MKKSKLPKIFIASAVTFGLAISAIAILYEGGASRNPAVNLSKRVVAEAGAFVSRRFMDGENGNDFSFGPGAENFENAEFAGNFQYEDLTNPKLKLLRERYDLNTLVADSGSEFKKIVILRNWVKEMIPRGRPRGVDYNFNALDILKRARNGESFFCSEYSTVFVQCALSLGVVGRYVGLFKGHVVAEVWSNEFSKWVVMDVDNNLHYEKEGSPLNALELHDLWERGHYKGLNVVKGLERKDLPDAEKKYLLSFYHEFYIRMRNDWFSNKYPHWHHKANSIMNGLEWQDRFTKNNVLVSRETGERDELYFPINITKLKVTPPGPGGEDARLILETFTPNFSHFLIEIEGEGQRIVKSGVCRWKLSDGINTVRVRAVNVLGVKGPESKIRIRL